MARKIIVVEGMDNVGKDTQIKAIANHYNTEIFHTLHYHSIKNLSSEEAQALAEKTYTEMFKLMLRSPTHNFILYRSHYGEYVYGHIYRQYVNPSYVFDLERQLLFKSVLNDAALIVLVNGDFAALSSREDGDSLSAGKAELMRQEYDRFYDVYRLSNIGNKMFIDVENSSREQITRSIVSYLDQALQPNTQPVDLRAPCQFCDGSGEIVYEQIDKIIPCGCTRRLAQIYPPIPTGENID